MKSVKDLLKDNEFSSRIPRNKEKKSADIFDFLELINNWDQVVGPKLVEHTIPLKLKNKNLTVLTSHPVFAQQLSFMEKAIIEKIYASFPAIQGQVRKIFFQADNRHFQQKKQQSNIKKEKVETFERKWHKQSPQYKKLMAKAETLLSDVQDDEIRESLKSIYIQMSDPEE
ncbi:DUF721 domain-containing protein [Bacteriovorax sp. DB6_IX]|uniref:DUF721 domain-containing protein n=1 Tax=Bacteriovorax sp. DB6_IX TaxID=1353530 RepID=UPI00038A4C3D|nr:DUF721 domain-containing protein [Bacteriovorax sp. DB6_IX]EQC51455.1 PF05258 family protein [Bacteriovorax sp. DB6_IX]